MPKILRVLNRLNIGGPTYNAAYLSKYLNPAYQTKLLAGFKEPYEGSSDYILNDLGVPYTYVPDMHRSINLKKDLKAYRYIKNFVNEYQPDIVHTHAAKAGVLGRLAAYHAKKRPAAIIHTYHGNVFDGYFSPLKSRVFLAIERYLCGISTAIVAISEEQKNDLVNKYKLAAAEKVHVIRLGFDLDKFATHTAEKRHHFRSFYQLSDDTVVISITGRLTAIKNHFLFIDSLKILRQQNPDVKFKAFIVGDGELMDEIITKVKDAGLSCCEPGESNYRADIIFTSWRKDIDVINAGSDIVVLTSINEGTPVSIIEAMASERAVVCTNVGGVKDVVQHGVSGMLAEQEPRDFAKKMAKLMLDQNLRDSLSANAKQFALEHYSYHRLIKETEKLYSLLLRQKT